MIVVKYKHHSAHQPAMSGASNWLFSRVDIDPTKYCRLSCTDVSECPPPLKIVAGYLHPRNAVLQRLVQLLPYNYTLRLRTLKSGIRHLAGFVISWGVAYNDRLLSPAS